MVGKLELTLSAILILVIAISLNNTIETKKKKILAHGNSIEIKNAQLIEANATNRLDDIKSDFAYQKDDVWHFKHFNLIATNIKELKANNAVRGKDYFELTGKIKMISNDGSKYWANRAVYLTDKKIFYTIGDFKAERNNTIAVGKNFYNAKLKGFSRAEKVHGIYQMATKKKSH